MVGDEVSSSGALLRAALVRDDGVGAAWHAWRKHADLDRLDTASASLLPLLGRNLERHAVATPDQPYFRWLHRAAWTANMRQLVEAGRLLNRLTAAGHEAVLLKGAALIASRAYDDAGLRPMADVDVLVRCDEASAVMGLLRTSGWKPVGWAAFCNAPELTIPVRHSHGFVHPSGAQVDLHWHVLWESCANDADAVFWARARTIDWFGRVVRVLDPAHQLLHVCVHGARWERPSTLRWVADAVHLLETFPALDWTEVEAAARRHGVVLALREALRTLVDLLAAPVPPDVLARLARHRIGSAERLQYRLQMTPPGLLRGLPLLAVHQWRLARSVGGWPVVGLPRYLRRMYEIEHLRQVPAAVAHGLRARRAEAARTVGAPGSP